MNTWLTSGASSVAQQTEPLIAALIALAIFFVAVVYGAAVYLIFKYRAGSPAERGSVPTSSLTLEALWIGVPLILAVSIFVWSAKIFFGLFETVPGAREIHVVGKQWMWKIYYPDGRTDVNELHLEEGVPTVLTLSSEDVVHSFYMPEMRLKMDAVPGRYTRMSFVPKKHGDYHILCAQYCGTDHSRMVGTLHVMKGAEYAEWKAHGHDMALALKGAALFHEKGCEQCHTEGGKGPNLSQIYGRYQTLADGQVVLAEENFLRSALLDPGRSILQGYPNVMPSFKDQLSEEQILELIEFIKSLPADSGTAVHQEKVSELPREQTPEGNQLYVRCG